MSRPSDRFTRFTASSPHAAQSPAFESRSIPQSQGNVRSGRPVQSGPDGETPAQKVARLRSAARAQKEGQLSTTDRVLARGRIWADIAHRMSAYALIGLTGVAGVVGTYALFSLITHNRRQKRAFIEREMDRLGEAQKAFLRGDANAEQLHLLEQERAGEEMAVKFKADRDKQKTRGLWNKMKGLVGAGASAGEKGSETEGEATARQLRKDRTLADDFAGTELRPVAVSRSDIQGVGYDAQGRPVPLSKMEKVVKQVEKERRTGEDEVTARTGITKGPLDVMADNISSAVVPQKSSGGWFSWGRSS